MSDPKVITDIKRKIEREQNIINSSTRIRESTNNSMVKEKCNTEIREANQNLEYLRKTLDNLSLSNSVSSSPTLYSNSSNQPYPNQRQKSHNPPNFTGLDLIKYDCPSLGHRIQYMLQLMEFKLQIENQYKEASEKMIRLYQSDADKLSSTAALDGRIESNKKIPLLTRALKRYRDMYVEVADVKEETDLLNNQRARAKPPTGVITIGISNLKDVGHIVSNGFLGKKVDSVILIKVDDELKVRTKPFKEGKLNESMQFQINVARNNEIEISVCDKVGDQLIPVGIVWFMISDIVEELRRKRTQFENSNNNWVSASNMPIQQAPGTAYPSNPSSASSHTRGPAPSSYGSANHDVPIFSPTTTTVAPKDITSTTRYILEPSGQILLTFGFVKTDTLDGSNVHDNINGGLGRHGAIRERKEATFEQYGHHFVQKNTYNIMMCAYCGEFARYSCYQCQDCRYLCHKKCYKHVVTKCFSKSSNEVDPDEAKLNHKIPHRWVASSNRGTKWCCHCGYILPWGKKNIRKCSECGIMSHSGCSHLVPDYCGMSMITANRILNTIKQTGSKNGSPIKQNFRSPPLGHQNQQQYQQERPSAELDFNGNVIGQGPNKNHRLSFIGGPPEQQRNEYASSQHSYSPKHDNFSKQQVPSQQRPISFIHPSISEEQDPLNSLPEIKIDQDYDKNNVFEQDHNPYGSNQFANSVGSHDVPNPFDQETQGDNVSEDQPQQYYNDYNTDNISKRISKIDMENNYAASSAPEFDISNSNPYIENIPVNTNKDHPVPYPDLEINDVNMDLDNNPKLIEEAPIIIPSQVSKPHKKEKRRRKVGLDDFQFLAVLGKGNFGKVMLAESRHTKKLCAIKVLKKDFILENDEVESTKSEKRVFLIANQEKCPFLINLHCCFQTANRIYFVMEYVSGGDLMWHIQKARFSQRRAQFYAAEVLLGLKYFHDNDVIYRDLKLDNILLTTSGHIKIADYGLCKEGMGYGCTTSTFCGTPEFMAPEILKEQKYGKAVDWWAFGVLLYQMLLGQSPFRGRDEEEIFDAILTDDPLYPIQMARESVEILQSLLTRDPTKRLGFGPKDAEEIKEHPYFRNINFDDIEKLKVDVPYLPEVRSEHDVSNFDDEFTAETPRLTPVNSTLDSSMQEKFRGFSHMSDDFVL